MLDSIGLDKNTGLDSVRMHATSSTWLAGKGMTEQTDRETRWKRRTERRRAKESKKERRKEKKRGKR
jgi:hypothetical protein